jgi:hypothetical protein
LSLDATSGAGALGAKLGVQILKLTRKEVTSIGSVSFLVPFFHCAAVDEYLLAWRAMPGWLAGVALRELR